MVRSNSEPQQLAGDRQFADEFFALVKGWAANHS
jgi:hypothetical protein